MKINRTLSFLLILLLCFVFQSLYSQTFFEVSGNVYDEFQEPIPGATIKVKEENIGAISNLNGFFSLESPSSDAVLMVSFIGYKTEEVKINGRKRINIILEEINVQLDEVSVIGYGTQKKAHLTGAVSSVDTDLLKDISTSDLSTVLQGIIPGLTIENTTSEVGVAPIIRVRGFSSLSAESAPLIIVDGVPMGDAFQMINPEDIQSIDVLKDASSTAIYGSRGANGVIIITTKEGVVGKPRYSIRVFSSSKYAHKLRDMMSYTEYVDRLNYENSIKGSGSVHPQYLSGQWLESKMGSTNWNKMLFKDAALTNNVSLSMSGGKPGVKYLLSFSYIKDEGLMLYNNNDRFTVRSKTDITINKNIDFTTNVSAGYRSYTRPSRTYDDFATYPTWLPARHNEFSSAFTGAPIGSYATGRDFNFTTPVYPVGPIDEQTDEPKLIGANPYNTINNNPLQILNSDLRQGQYYSFSGNAGLKIKITNDLIFNSSANLIASYSPYQRYVFKDATRDGETNHGYFNSRLYLLWQNENTLNYTKNVGDHNFDILAGFSAEKRDNERVFMHAIDFPTDFIHTLNAATQYVVMSTSGRSETGTSEDSETLASLLGRINYNYKERYLLSLASRLDGSSLLGVGNKWGSFPSISVGWIASEETFLKSQKWLNNLKIRSSYGLTGNNAIQNYATVDLLSTAMYSFGPSQGLINTGLANNSTTLANRYLKWEQTEEMNAGIDIHVFKSKFTLSLDAYSAKTRSLLFKRPIQSFSGFKESWENIGKLHNKGIETSLTYNLSKKNLRLSSTLIFAATNNRLLQLGGEDRIVNEGITKELYINQVGSPVVQFYGYKTDGVWKNQEEIDSSPHFATGIDQPGTLKVVDINNDGIINEKDYTVLGNPYPDFNFGFNNRFNYKNIDISLLIEGVYGSKIINSDMTRQHYQIRDKKYNTSNTFISPDYPGDYKTPTRYGIQWILTDYAVEDNSYVALRNVTFGYSLPKNLLQKVNLKKFRVYIAGNNLFYIWSNGYRGINPESLIRSGVYSSPLVSGYQRGSFPVVISGTAGLEIIF